MIASRGSAFIPSPFSPQEISAIPNCNSYRLGPIGHARIPILGKKAGGWNWPKKQNHDYKYGFLRLSILKM